MLFNQYELIDEDRKKEIEDIESKYNLSIPDTFKDFYYIHDVFPNIDPYKLTLVYKSPLLKHHTKRDYIELQNFCAPGDMRLWINNLLFSEHMFNGEGLQLMKTYGSTFLLIIANKGSKDYGKIVFYDVEEAENDEEIRYILADSFEEFIGYLTTLDM